MTEQQLENYALEHTDDLGDGDWQVIKLPEGIKALVTAIDPAEVSLLGQTDAWVKKHHNYDFWFQKYLYRYYLPAQKSLVFT